MPMNYEELEKLADLKEKGIITEEEFIAKKSEIMNLDNNSSNDNSSNAVVDEVASTNEVANKEENISFNGVKEYYKKEFKKIENSNETYKGSWNWAAFWLGPFWALSKGIWSHALISFIGSILTGGLVGFIYVFIFSLRGTYMHYNVKIKDKQELNIF